MYSNVNYPAESLHEEVVGSIKTRKGKVGVEMSTYHTKWNFSTLLFADDAVFGGKESKGSAKIGN